MMQQLNNPEIIFEFVIGFVCVQLFISALSKKNTLVQIVLIVLGLFPLVIGIGAHSVPCTIGALCGIVFLIRIKAKINIIELISLILHCRGDQDKLIYDYNELKKKKIEPEQYEREQYEKGKLQEIVKLFEEYYKNKDSVENSRQELEEIGRLINDYSLSKNDVSGTLDLDNIDEATIRKKLTKLIFNYEERRISRDSESNENEDNPIKKL